MRGIRGILIAAAASVVGSSALRAQDADIMLLREAWTLPAHAGDSAHVYITFQNETRIPFAVLAVTSTVAAKVGGSGLGAQIADVGWEPSAFLVPAHGIITMRPNGAHLTLHGLTRNLQTNDEIPLTLHALGGFAVTITVKVRRAGVEAF